MFIMGQLSEACNSRGGWFLKGFVFLECFAWRQWPHLGKQPPAGGNNWGGGENQRGKSWSEEEGWPEGGIVRIYVGLYCLSHTNHSKS